jgi:chaperonin GroES
MDDIWTNQVEDEIPEGFFEDLPIKPFYWRVLVMPMAAREKSAGGIIIAQAAQEAQQHLTYHGKVIAVGSQAFKEPRLGGDKAGVGDWIVYGRYAGQRLEYKKGGRCVRLLIVNDDEVLGKVSDPNSLRVHT